MLIERGRALRRWIPSLRRVLSTHYPSFLFGRVENPGPHAFVYHDVEPETFEADLRFLSDNGYWTLTTADFVATERGRKSSRSVLLTFDDAGLNFFEVTLPLLMKYGAKATVFAPTYWVGRKDKSVTKINAGGQFMTWEQLLICRESGLVDVQSHAHRHALVHTSNRLIGFASPASIDRQHFYDWPMRWNGYEDELGPPPLGTPIYISQPLLSADHRILEDSKLARICQNEVSSHGGASFFIQKNWKSELESLYFSQIRHGVNFIRLDRLDFERLVVSEFVSIQHIFKKRLGKESRFLAYPWMLGSKLSLKIAQQHGINAVFGVGLDFRHARKVQGPLKAFGRIKGEWLRFLPGNGRLRLHQVLPAKIKAFINYQHLAH